MYCPVCGSSDQEADSYCRNCGQFLTDFSISSFLLNRFIGGSSVRGQVNFNLAISLITIFTSFLLMGFLAGYYDALEARTGETAPPVIDLVYVFLAVIGGWQILSLIINARLRARLKKRPELKEQTDVSNSISSYKTQELLPEANPRADRPLVDDQSTELLKVKPRQ